MTNKPIVSPYKGLRYDIDEIETSMYMFNHLCSGCIIFKFNEPVSSNGRVFLNGNIHTDWKLTEFIFNNSSILIIYLRGYLTEYDSSADICIEDFSSISGQKMDSTHFKVLVGPRRNTQSKYAENDAVALKAACESIVLLKNEDDTLPIKKNKILNFFGKGYSEYRNCAVGAARINPRIYRSIKQAVEETSDFTINKSLDDFYKVPNNRLPASEVLIKAKSDNDLAIIVFTRGSGENIDNRPIKGEYYLSDEEDKLLEAVTDFFSKTVVVLNTGYPIDVSFLDKYKIDACIYTGFGGMFATDALIEVLSGKTNPSAKLPDTWPMDYFDSPSSKNFLNFKENQKVLQTDDKLWSQICYEEGIYVGYRYFSSFGVPVAFPFGYGLSYSTFSKDIVEFKETEKGFELSVKVTNTGEYQGKETVQIYLKKSDSILQQANIELVEFSKSGLLKVGESEVLNLFVPINRLASFDESTSSWVISLGEYGFYLGENCSDLKKIGTRYFDRSVTIKKCLPVVRAPFDFEELSVRNKDDFEFGKKTFTSTEPLVLKNDNIPTLNEESNTIRSNLKFRDVLERPYLAEEFVSQLTNEQLCRLNVCWNSSVWSMNIKGIAGRISGMEEYGIPEYLLTDGNSGVHVKTPNIGFPASGTISASFDKELMYQVGCVLANEALEYEIDCILGPGMNLHRNLLNGRHAEYFSEDPLLSGIMAGYQVKGLQDSGVSACIKHVIANNCEAVRKRSNSIISQRALRELYIRSYEYSFEIDLADTLMTGYNAINGVFCDENFELLELVFHKELGFDGFVMSDWNSYDTSDIVTMVKAGVSLLTPGTDDDKYITPLLQALNEGRISRKELIRNVLRIINVEVKRINVRGVKR